MLFIPSSQETATGVSESQLHSHKAPSHATITACSRYALESKNSQTRGFINVFVPSCDQMLYRARRILCTSSLPLYLRTILILSSYLHFAPQVVSSLQIFRQKIVYAFHIHPVQDTCPTHPFSFTESSYQYARIQLRSSKLCNFFVLLASPSSSLSPHIILNTFTLLSSGHTNTPRTTT
jgi:hypothetical protein